MSAFDGLPFELTHVIRVALNPDIPYLLNACGAVGSEYKREQFCNGVIEFFTVVRVRDLTAVRTGCKILLATTGAYLAPGGFLVVVTTRTSFCQVGAASSAIKPAVGDEI